MGDAASALEDLDYSTQLNHDDVQTWVKKASVHMELGESVAAFKDFDEAIGVDPQNSDMCFNQVDSPVYSY
jgi:import receptor subunit TOM70